MILYSTADERGERNIINHNKYNLILKQNLRNYLALLNMANDTHTLMDTSIREAFEINGMIFSPSWETKDYQGKILGPHEK